MDKVAEILFYRSPHGICFVAPNGRFMKVNTRLCKMLGYSAEELLALDFQGLTHPDDLPLDAAQVQRVLIGEINITTWLSATCMALNGHGCRRSYL